MTVLTPRLGFLAALALIILSRPAVLGHHMPDATLATFFLMGALVPGRRWLLGLLAFRLSLMFAGTIASEGVAACVTPALAAMPLAYTLMWQAGRVVSRQQWLRVGALFPLSLALAGGAAAAFVVSSGSYHFLSGHVADPSWAAFVERTLRYFPAYLASSLPYVSVALVAKAMHERYFASESRV